MRGMYESHTIPFLYLRLSFFCFLFPLLFKPVNFLLQIIVQLNPTNGELQRFFAY